MDERFYRAWAWMHWAGGQIAAGAVSPAITWTIHPVNSTPGDTVPIQVEAVGGVTDVTFQIKDSGGSDVGSPIGPVAVSSGAAATTITAPTAGTGYYVRATPNTGSAKNSNTFTTSVAPAITWSTHPGNGTSGSSATVAVTAVGAVTSVTFQVYNSSNATVGSPVGPVTVVAGSASTTITRPADGTGYYVKATPDAGSAVNSNTFTVSTDAIAWTTQPSHGTTGATGVPIAVSATGSVATVTFQMKNSGGTNVGSAIGPVSVSAGSASTTYTQPAAGDGYYFTATPNVGSAVDSNSFNSLAAIDGILLEDGSGFLAMEASVNDALLLGPYFDLVDGSTGTLTTGDAAGTVVGTVTWLGDPATLSLTGGDASKFAINSSTGVVTRSASGTVTAGSISLGISGSVTDVNGFTASDTTTMDVTVTSAAFFSSEPGTQVVVGSYATHSNGASVATGDLLWGTNGRLYYVTTGGTLGATSPTHTSGSASNGTATLEHAVLPDYSSTNYSAIQTACAAFGASLSAPQVVVVWGKGEVSGSSEILNLNGASLCATTSTNTLTVKVKAEFSFKAAASPVLRYDPAKGLAFSVDAFTALVAEGGVNHFRFSGFQIKPTGSSGGSWTYLRSTADTGSQIVEDCIVESGHGFDVQNSVFRDVVLVLDSTDNPGGILAGTSYMIGVTSIRAPGQTAGGAPYWNYGGTSYISNCIFSGFTDTAEIGGGVWANNAATNSGVHAAGGTGNVTTTNSALFVNPSSTLSSADWRLKSGSTAIGVGTVAPTFSKSTDILGTTRGASWDIGAHEYV